MSFHTPEPFDPSCRRCPRLAAYLDEARVRYPGYHAAPVPDFGDADARLLIVGLAPGFHGANATGRPFTGDYAGELLYRTLHAFGFGSRPQSLSADDGLLLKGCRITNAVRCVPPENKPTGAEVNNCNGYLAHDIERLGPGDVVLALGRVAHTAVVKAERARQKDYPFRHGVHWPLPSGRLLLDTYHCSRYNTQTGRLTEAMFQAVFETAVSLLRDSRMGPA